MLLACLDQRRRGRFDKSLLLVAHRVQTLGMSVTVTLARQFGVR